MTIGFLAADPEHWHERAQDIRPAATLMMDAVAEGPHDQDCGWV